MNKLFFINKKQKQMSTKKEQRPEVIRLDGVRFSWPFIFEKDDNDKHRVTVIVDKKDKKNLKKIETVLKYAYSAGVADPKMWNGKKPKSPKQPLQDGDEPKENGEPKGDELAGAFHFTASSNRPVLVVDKQNRPLESDEDFYGGCYGSIILVAKAYKEKSVGIGLYVNAICKTEDGDRFGGGGTIDTKEAFGDLFESDGMFDDDDDDDGEPIAPKKSKKSTKTKPVDDDDDDDDDFNPFA